MKYKLKVFFNFLYIYTSRSPEEDKLSQKTLVIWYYTLRNTQRPILAVVLRAFSQVSSFFRYAPHHSRNKRWPRVSEGASWTCWEAALVPLDHSLGICNWVGQADIYGTKIRPFSQGSTEQPFASRHRSRAVPSSTPFLQADSPQDGVLQTPCSMECHLGKSALINTF